MYNYYKIIHNVFKTLKTKLNQTTNAYVLSSLDIKIILQRKYSKM